MLLLPKAASIPGRGGPHERRGGRRPSVDDRVLLTRGARRGRSPLGQFPAMLGISGNSTKREGAPAPYRLVLCTRVARLREAWTGPPRLRGSALRPSCARPARPPGCTGLRGVPSCEARAALWRLRPTLQAWPRSGCHPGPRRPEPPRRRVPGHRPGCPVRQSLGPAPRASEALPW